MVTDTGDTELPAVRAPQKRPSLRDEQKLITRKRLLVGSLEVFELKGYASTTVDGITSQAGTSRATFYLHFKSKFEIIEALHTRRSLEIHRLFSELDGIVIDGTRERIKEWTAHTLDWYEENSVYALALEQAVLVEGAAAANMRRPYLEFMPNLRAAWPSARHEEVNLRAWLLVKSMTAFFIGRSLYGLHAANQADGAIDAITDLCIAGLRPFRNSP